MTQSLADSLTGTSISDTDARVRWLETRWTALRPYERAYALTDIAMRLGRLTATTSNHAALSVLVARFREMESSLLATMGKIP